MFNTKVKAVEQPFPDKLREYVAHPPAGSVKMLITPEMALEMLTFNTRNRPVTNAKVALYARQMKAGEWHYTRVPIIFSDQGRVIDGQHRLYACIEAENAFPADVAFGAPDDSFAFIDIGKTRTAGDIFAINGVKNHNAMAAMCRLLHNYANGFGFHGSKVSASPSELYEFYLSCPSLQESITVCSWFGASRLAAPSIMGACHYLCAQKNRKEADYFFDIACHGGATRVKNAPENELHKQLIRMVTAGHNPGANELAGLTITAWNRARSGLSGKGMKFDGGKFPAVR